MLDLLIKAETEGVDDIDEAIEVAIAYITTGLVRSAGRFGRYVRDIHESFPAEFEAACDAAGIEIS